MIYIYIHVLYIYDGIQWDNYTGDVMGYSGICNQHYDMNMA